MKTIRTLNALTGRTEETRIDNTKETGMYERFTDRARKVMQLANQEAQRFNHEYIHVEHILIGMVREGGGNAYQALMKCSNLKDEAALVLARLRFASEKIKPGGPDMVTMGRLPHTPKVKEILESAVLSAHELFHDDYVCSENILMAIVTDKDLETCAVLRAIGINPDDVRDEILHLMRKGSCPIDKLDAAFDAAANVARMTKEREEKGESKHPIRDANEEIKQKSIWEQSVTPPEGAKEFKVECRYATEEDCKVFSDAMDKIRHDGIYQTLDDVGDEITKDEAMAYRDGAFRMCALNHAVTLATHCKLEGTVLDAAQIFYNFLSGKNEEGKE